MVLPTYTQSKHNGLTEGTWKGIIITNIHIQVHILFPSRQ